MPMQTVWSRAIRSSCTCRCSTCFSSGTALARRTTTAAARRGLRFGDTFTAFYSSIFAFAAIADAKSKDARRQKWDEVIAEAQEDLEALERMQQSRIDSSSADVRLDNETESVKQMSWQELFSRATQEKKTRIALGVEGLKGVSLDLLEKLSSSEIEQLLPEAVCGYSETDFWGGWKSDRYFRTGFPTKKLKIFELSISKLVLRFLLESEERRNAIPDQPKDPEATGQQSSSCYRKELAGRIANINIRLSALSHVYPWPRTSIDLETPSRPKYVERFVDDKLNVALRSVFLASEEQKADIDTLTSRICYNLLASSTPPDVNTYNMLIIVLCRLREHGLVRAVLESMHECHVPPNEITISSTLRFYTATNDRSGFARYVKMVGSRNGLLDLGYPGTAILSRRNQVLPGYLHKRRRLFRTEDSTGLPVELATQEEAACMLVIQKAPRNQAVLEELFCGTLKFFGLSQARYCYKALVEEGWEVNVRILTLMLKSCAREKNWRLGRMVWQQLQDLALEAGKKAYYWMLQLCHTCQRDREFHSVLKQASCHGIHPGIPASWSLSSLERQLEAACRTISDTARRVGDAELRIYRGPSVGRMTYHKSKMLSLESVTTLTNTARRDGDSAQLANREMETRPGSDLKQQARPVPAVKNMVVQTAEDHRLEQSTLQLLSLPYDDHRPPPRYRKDLPPVTQLAENPGWERQRELAVMTA